VGHLRYKYEHYRGCSSQLVPDATSTVGFAAELLRGFVLENAITDSMSRKEMQQLAKVRAEAEYRARAYQAFCSFADIAAGPVLEYLARHEDARGEVSANMKLELRTMALTWESRLKSPEGSWLTGVC
jgi:hypothetical protein